MKRLKLLLFSICMFLFIGCTKEDGNVIPVENNIDETGSVETDESINIDESGSTEIPEDKLLHRALNQMARENLLLQSSDWPFLITTWQAKDYATDRFNEHVDRFSFIADIRLI